jgi:hypothetical protein
MNISVRIDPETADREAHEDTGVCLVGNTN